MAHHHLPVHPDAVHDIFSSDLKPVLTVDSGDTVTIETLDARGYLARPADPTSRENTMLADARGHTLSGPIHVRGANPGTAIAVRLQDITPGDWGWTAAGGPVNRFMDCLGLPRETMTTLLWELDADAKRGSSIGLGVDLRPFLGVIGLAPTEPGEHTTTPPRYCGGNIDCKDLTAGSVLFLPVGVEGGLLSIGDGHARQGDGEVSGTAIECPMTTTLELTVVAEPELDTIHAITPTGRITFGFDEDLATASGAALNAMITWITQLHGVTRAQALALSSAAVDLRITQVANGTWGVHAVLEHEAITAQEQA